MRKLHTAPRRLVYLWLRTKSLGIPEAWVQQSLLPLFC